MTVKEAMQSEAKRVSAPCTNCNGRTWIRKEIGEITRKYQVQVHFSSTCKFENPVLLLKVLVPPITVSPPYEDRTRQPATGGRPDLGAGEGRVAGQDLLLRRLSGVAFIHQQHGVKTVMARPGTEASSDSLQLLVNFERIQKSSPCIANSGPAIAASRLMSSCMTCLSVPSAYSCDVCCT